MEEQENLISDRVFANTDPISVDSTITVCKKHINIVSDTKNFLKKEVKKYPKIKIKDSVFIDNLLENDNVLVFINNIDQQLICAKSHSGLVLHEDIILDKNFNKLRKGKYSKPHIDYIALPFYFNNLLKIKSSVISSRHISYVVIEKKSFIDSKGKDFKIIYKNNISYKDILKLKHKCINLFNITVEKVKILKESLSLVYDENEYDIITQIDINTQNIQFIIIQYFKELEIRNSLEFSKKITNLFIYTQFVADSYGNLYLYHGLKGHRNSFTESEIASGYIHSHLSKGCFLGVSSYCLGSNSIFRPFEQVENSNSPYSVVFNQKEFIKIEEHNIDILFFGIKNTVEWESLEGGPYIRIEDCNIFRDKASIDDYKFYPSLYMYQESRFINNGKTIVNFIIKHFQNFKECFTIKKINNKFQFDYDLNNAVNTLAYLNRETKELEDISTLCYNSSSNSIFNTIKNKKRIDNTILTIPSIYLNKKRINRKLLISEEDVELEKTMLNIPDITSIIMALISIKKTLNKKLKDYYEQ